MDILGLDDTHKTRKQYVYCPLWKRLILRFLRGFISAFAASFAAFAATSPEDWTVTALAATIIAGASGGILALDKYLREDK